MQIARRGAGAAFAVCLVAAGIAVAAPAARAATCQSVPASTPGANVRLAGQDHRVPSISGISVCADGPTAPLVVVDPAGHGNCLSLCLTILLDGNDLDAGAVTLSYARDGVVETSTTDLPPVAGPGDECLLSVGSPNAPYPTCFNAIGAELGDPLGDAGDEVDEAVATVWDVVGDPGSEVGEAVDTVEAAAQQVIDAADDPCGSVPPKADPWNQPYYVEFCQDPARWAYLAAVEACFGNSLCYDAYVDSSRLYWEVVCTVAPPGFDC